MPANRFLVLMLCCLAGAVPAVGAAPAVHAIHGIKVYPGPDAEPIDQGVVLVRGKTIAAVGPRRPGDVPAKPLARQCDGGVIVAGFQNSHAHLIGPSFEGAARAPAAELSRGLMQVFTRYGYTTVFDIASDRDNTLALRARVTRGEVTGPRILTAGLPLFPANGLPVYMSHLSPSLLARMPQPTTADGAAAVVRDNIDAGADAAKLFLVTPQADHQLKRMAPDIARAAVAEAHRRGKLVFAHPTDPAGLRAAMDAGVDILAHPPLGTPGPWPEDLMRALREAGVAMVPTLKLLPYELAKEQVPADVAERIVSDNVAEFGKFAAAGGTVLFGTDVDYMDDADPTLEYELMARAGMTTMQILASLTTAPAERWKESGRRGRLAPGLAADIVVLEADPAESPKNFARVKCALRDGAVIYAK